MFMLPQFLISRLSTCLLLFLALYGSSDAYGQSPKPATKRVRINHFDTLAYPLHSKFAISVTGSPILKDLEFWVYDVKGIEVYYSIQTIPISEQFIDIIPQIIDREYQQYMMQHGFVMKNRRKY